MRTSFLLGMGLIAISGTRYLATGLYPGYMAALTETPAYEALTLLGKTFKADYEPGLST
jgi:hypothetical protein